MKKVIIIIISTITLLFQGTCKAQSNDVVYTLIYNSVYDEYPYPMIGFVNVVNGDFNRFQLGFVNSTLYRNNGAQVGFINHSGSINGAQLGYINSSRTFVNGFQAGFINGAGTDINGFQAGFINLSNGWVDGFQLGFVNAVRNSVDGMQVGSVNVAADTLDGAQLGFVNVTSRLKGLQLGFVNVTDSVEDGIPIGFVSVVRKGGYKALGYYADELFPVNISFRIGVKGLYTCFVLSHNNRFENKFALGAGVGSIMNISPKVFFNPELMSQNSINSSLVYQHNNVLNLSLGYNVGTHLHLSAGPSLSWSYSSNLNHSMEPIFRIYDFMLNGHNKLHVGLRAGLYVSL